MGGHIGPPPPSKVRVREEQKYRMTGRQKGIQGDRDKETGKEIETERADIRVDQQRKKKTETVCQRIEIGCSGYAGTVDTHDILP